LEVSGDKPLPVVADGLAWRQFLTVALLFGGYGSLYFCRADLSVATPMLIEELRLRGVDHAHALVTIGQVSSLGVLAYAVGKIFFTGLGDFWGGKPNFLIGLAGATVFTLLFTLGTVPSLFMAAWIGNRLTQSLSWAGLLKVSSKWFDFTSTGFIIGVLSVSFLVGDAVARQWMGYLIHQGYRWQELFYLAAGVAGFFLIANAWLLRESRVQRGFSEAKPNPSNVYGAAVDRPKSIKALLLPLVTSRAYLLVCLLSLGCTIMRETFNAWTPSYLKEYFGFSISDAASASAVFPALGAVSVIATGWLSDRLGPNSRAAIMAVGLTATALSLVVLSMLPADAAPSLPLITIGATALCLLGPYSYLGGAMAVDFGGKQGTAVSSGIIDGVGYLGSVMAGDTVARIAIAMGWKGVFWVLAGISLVSAVGAGELFRTGRRAALSESR
jgi:sugar phosphate permease